MKNRRPDLDGLRGLAALVVVLEHMTVLMSVGAWNLGTGIVSDLASSAVNFPFRAGTFACYVFFIISGDVIAASAVKSPPIFVTLAARYGRLTGPMLVSTIFAWVLLNIWPDNLVRVSKFTTNHWTETIYQSGPKTFLDAAIEALGGVYWTGKPYFNPALWTMQVELFGSFGVYIFYRFVSRRWRPRLLVLAAIALIVSGFGQYVAFPLGALLFEASIRDALKSRYMSEYFIVSGVSFAILASSRLGRALGAAIETRLHIDILSVPVLYSLAALCLSFGVMTSPVARAFLGGRVPQFFGRISFSLYLLHMPILYTGFTALFIAFGHPRAEITLVLWALGFVVTAVAAAMVMTRLIDEPLMGWLKSKRHRAEAT